MLLNKHWSNADLSDVVIIYMTSHYLIWPSLILLLKHMLIIHQFKLKTT